MAKVPKKNISRIVSDIKEISKDRQKSIPHGEPITMKTERLGDWAPRARSRDSYRPPRRRIPWTVISIVIVIVTSVVLYQYGKGVHGSEPVEQKMNIVDEFKERFLPFLKEGVRIYQGIGTLGKSSFTLLGKLDELSSKWPELILKNKGTELISTLRDIESELTKFKESLGDIKDANTKLPFGAENEFALVVDLERWQATLRELIAWLTSEPRHIAVLLLNPAEIRPGGGFLGSFADITLQDGAIQNIVVRDINEVDRTLLRRIVPPKPFQLFETRWRAADSNWFFDFRDSAEETLSFFDHTSLYRDQHIQFDAVIAVSPKVVSDILALTGPISRPDSKTQLTSKNFLYEIQKSVQEGQAVVAESPKKILSDLVPVLQDAIINLSPGDKAKILTWAKEWIDNRDVMGYVRNETLQKNLEHYNIAGRVYVPPRDFEGDYLAVVNANIGGAKTDLFMQNRVTLESQINLDGLVSNHLTVSRSHHGYESPYWWYREPNQNYMKVFTPSSADLVGSTGGIEKSIIPKVNFKNGNYETDPYVAKIESTLRTYRSDPEVTGFVEEGKNVFALWSRTALRTTSTLALDYEHRLYVPPEDGGEYTFVLERQMSDASKYRISINAPVGYVWKENNLPVYEYSNDHPLGREILTLTFKKI